MDERSRLIGGRYTIEEVLGRGGAGKVYRVHDARSGRTLALKRVWATDGKKAQRRRMLLEREYHTLAQLAHPRIIEVVDFGSDDEGPFYTMELLDGADLADSGRMPWRQACELLRDVASSLAILHARGLIHRDVSLRNVRRTANGRAKLIDFGAMTSMGVAKDIVGTPMFMAPEVLQLQALDARADLFALGAVAYYLLTGRHAYPARRVSELRDIWRSQPAPPLRIVAEIPPALSTLVSQLTMLDRNARPHSAAEVMERLCAIAGLPLEEQTAVSRAYLATPTLVGQEKALVAIRRRVLSLVRGDGGTLLVEGLPGTGRSRILDVCAFEGKLLGAAVARADAGDAGQDWGAARSLCNQLFELMPKEAADASRLSVDVIGHVIDGLRSDSVSSGSPPERSLLLRELRDFILTVARSARVLLIVDDVERIDEPSAALLAALAYNTERRSIVIALSSDTNSPQSSSSVGVLRGVADRVELEPLTAQQTLVLMKSLFGEVANLHLCADRIHTYAAGSPRTAIELAQHMVDRGIARYAAGSWSLPPSIGEGDLPRSLSATLAARIEALSPAARELAYLVCLSEGGVLRLSSVRVLRLRGDERETFRALDELMAARVLVAEGDRYHISQRSFLSELERAMSPADRAKIHGWLADLLAGQGGEVLRRAYHLLHADRDIEAVDLLCSIDMRVHVPPLTLIELALERAQQRGMPARMVQRLRIGVLSRAPLDLAAESFRRVGPPAFAQLAKDSSLSAYHVLSHVPEAERLAAAIELTKKRFAETPEDERVHAIPEALRELTRVAGSWCSMGAQTFDGDWIRAMPSLAPLAPLSPAVEFVGTVVERNLMWTAGRRVRSGEITEQLLQRLAMPDRAGLDEAQHNRTRLALLYGQGLVEASMGNDMAEQRAHVLEGDREHRVSAFRMRMVLHLNQGNPEQARACLRAAEQLQLQEGVDLRYQGASAALELFGYAEARDLLGIQTTLDGVARIAARCTGWWPVLAYGQAHRAWLRGDPRQALETLLPALDQAKLGSHPYAAELAASHLGLLGELGSIEEGRSYAERYLEICRREQLAPGNRLIAVAAADVLLRAGDHAQAAVVLEAAIEEARRFGQSGLAIGGLHEVRARVAIAMRDDAAFEQAVNHCTDELRARKSSVLSQKLARLLSEAREQRTFVHAALGLVRAGLEVDEDLGSTQRAVRAAFVECTDGSERARCALMLLLQSAEADGGALFGVFDERVELLAALPTLGAADGLIAFAQRAVQSELTAGATVTVSVEEEPLLAADSDDAAAERAHQALLLIADDEATPMIAAVLVLPVTPNPRAWPPQQLRGAIAHELLAQQDVSGVPIPILSATQEV